VELRYLQSAQERTMWATVLLYMVVGIVDANWHLITSKVLVPKALFGGISIVVIAYMVVVLFAAAKRTRYEAVEPPAQQQVQGPTSPPSAGTRP